MLDTYVFQRLPGGRIGKKRRKEWKRDRRESVEDTRIEGFEDNMGDIIQDNQNVHLGRFKRGGGGLIKRGGC